MNCISCGLTASPRSKEHVFAQWLLEFLDASRLRIGLFREKLDGSNEPHRQEIELDSFRLNRVCKSCNGGWMWQLESEAKPVLQALITQKISLGQLRREQRQSSG
jgi:hypothetical protein